MCDGHIVYQGDAKTSDQYFASIGYNVPRYANPADYYIKVLTINYPKEELDEKKIDVLQNSYKSIL